MTTHYAESGRTQQKARTRDALVATVRQLLAEGLNPTVEQVAEVSGISRPTTYRYFPNQRALLLAAHPEIDKDVLLGPNAPDTLAGRLDAVLDEHFRILIDWEPQLRASLRASLEPGVERPHLRAGRAIGWIQDALEPFGEAAEMRALAVRVRAVAGIEAYVWLRDIAGQSECEALATMRTNAFAVVTSALPRARRGAKGP